MGFEFRTFRTYEAVSTLQLEPASSQFLLYFVIFQTGPHNFASADPPIMILLLVSPT
jgi:hypothetical protein